MSCPRECRRRRSLCCWSAIYFLVTSLMALTLCDAYRGLIPPDPENPSKCVYRGDTLKAGENVGIGPCQRLTCNEDGSILVEGCGRVRIENCNSGERLYQNESYPLCCMVNYKCKRTDGSTYYILKNMAETGPSKAENST